MIGRFCRRNVDLSRTRVPVDDADRIELTIGVTQSTDQGELTPRILHLPGPAALLNVRSPRVIIFTCSFDHFTWYGRSSVTSCNMYEGPGDFFTRCPHSMQSRLYKTVGVRLSHR